MVADEEITGDNYWHVAAFTTCVLSAAAISEANTIMTSIVAQAGVEYDGWQATLTAGEANDLLR